MRKLLLLVVVAASINVNAGTLLADLCDACADQVYVTAIGKCAVCGGQTPSQGLKICETCSKKLGQCEACRKKLKKAATQPAGGTTQPTTQPTKSPSS